MIPFTMILVGSLIILALAGYWMRRAAKAEQRVKELDAVNFEMGRQWFEAVCRLGRISKLETPSMAHIGKVAVAIARGRR